MRASQAASQAGVTVKALRYYERLGLLRPHRLGNGYRDYRSADVAVAAEIRRLAGLGLTPREAQPFVACLDAGHDAADDCAEALAAYQRKIDEIDGLIDRLVATRDTVTRRLREAAYRGLLSGELDARALPRPAPLPRDLPIPVDDGAAAHLVGRRLPPLRLPSTDGCPVVLDQVSDRRWVLFVYPMTGDPAADVPRGWSDIPGARGCSAEACGFRDRLAEFHAAGVDMILGLSVDSTDYQRHLARRLQLPYRLVSDPDVRLARALDMPTFEVAGAELYKRLTMVVEHGVIRHVFYPVFPPDGHAFEVLGWLREAGGCDATGDGAEVQGQ